MRETVSTVPHSTLLLPLDKVMLETAYVHVCVGGWGGSHVRACACERVLYLYLVCVLLSQCVCEN